MSLPPGYRSRPAGRDDLDALARMVQEADLADVGFTDPTADEILETWAQPWFDLASDSLVVEGTGGEVAAYVEVGAQDPSGQVRSSARVHPSHRGRGIGAHVAGWIEARAAELVPQGVTAPLRNGYPATDGAAEALLAARGYAHVRSFWHLERELTGDEAPPPDPAGITIRSGTEGDDQRATWAILEASFIDHFGYEPLTFEEWIQTWSGFPGYDPSWVLLAFEGEVPVGVSVLLRGDEMVWVADLGVLAPWRGRGVGMALLQRSFAFIAATGSRQVRLGVDTENATGATRLYERAGMTVRREFRVVERAVRGGAPAD